MKSEADWQQTGDPPAVPVPPPGRSSLFRDSAYGFVTDYVLTSLDSPRTIRRVIVAKCVWRIHFHAN